MNAGKESCWIAHGIVRESARFHLVCFPFAGGTAADFAAWKEYLPREYSVYPVLYPMRERRSGEYMPEKMEKLAECFVRENMSIFEKPFVIFGQCTGCLIAYEVCRYLWEHCRKEPLLFVASGSASPHVRIVEEQKEEICDQWLLEMLLREGRLTEEAIQLPMFMEYYFPVLKADFALLAGYGYPGDYILSCPILTVAAEGDTLVPMDEVQKWSRYTEAEHYFFRVQGNHYFLREQGAAICARIDRLLEEKYKYVN
ncbi:MAG: thioesterase domain-containing protein [Lachnospiraceae bacterium]|nr:thioesterase domain-containing protein [Lachnospiraceae bacterium]